MRRKDMVPLTGRGMVGSAVAVHNATIVIGASQDDNKKGANVGE